MKLAHLRGGRLLCWLITGHIWDRTGTRSPASRSMNTCIYCGHIIAGPD